MNSSLQGCQAPGPEADPDDILPLLAALTAGKVALSMYKAAQGIEAYVYEDKIEDADAGGNMLVL